MGYEYKREEKNRGKRTHPNIKYKKTKIEKTKKKKSKS